MFRILKLDNLLANSTDMTFTGKICDEHKEQYDNFMSKYKIILLLENSMSKDLPLKSRSERICRFCKKKQPEVTFRMDAHIAPELIGNKNLLSDSECDSCNAKFSKYEDSLANYLGIIRSVNRTKTKEGVPKFKTPDNKFIITEGYLDAQDTEKKIVFESHDRENNHFEYDEAAKQIKMRITKHSYNPYKVFKSILKIGLSLVKDEEVANYQRAFEILQTDEHDDENPKAYTIVEHLCPGPAFPSPLYLLFEKKATDEAIPTHIFVMYFENFIYQIALPYNNKDRWMYDGIIEIGHHILPPLMDEPWVRKFGKPKQYIVDMSKNEKIKNASQEIIFELDKPIFQDSES